MDGRTCLLFSTPRSGSTWLMELIWTQPGFKYCNQPLSLFNPLVRQHLGIDRWEALYEASVPTFERYFRRYLRRGASGSRTPTRCGGTTDP